MYNLKIVIEGKKSFNITSYILREFNMLIRVQNTIGSAQSRVPSGGAPYSSLLLWSTSSSWLSIS